MKRFFTALGLMTSFVVGVTLAQQSPLAPPVLPKPADTPKTTTLKLGDKAPDFALPNGDGKLILLSDYTQRSPVVLVFYRGYW